MLDAVSRQGSRSHPWQGVWRASTAGQALAIHEGSARAQWMAAWSHPLYNLAHYGPDGAEDGWRDFVDLALEQEDEAYAHPLWNLGRL